MRIDDSPPGRRRAPYTQAMNAGASALPLRRPDDRFDRGSSARHRGQLTKVEPARVFALVIAVDRRERNAKRKPPIAVPQRNAARPRRGVENHRRAIAFDRARMAFEPATTALGRVGQEGVSKGRSWGWPFP